MKCFVIVKLFYNQQAYTIFQILQQHQTSKDK